MTDLKFGIVGDTFAWFITKDGMVVDQGWENDMQTAVAKAGASLRFWEVHDYIRE